MWDDKLANLQGVFTDEYKYQLPDADKGKKHRHGQASFSSRREAKHRDRRIVVKTTYRIEIDGKPIHAHIGVADDGSVHCHGIPNYSTGSALDLARALIDADSYGGVLMPGGDDMDDQLDDHGGHR